MAEDSENYEALKAENEKLRRQRADLTWSFIQNHPNKASFIFELLQNAEDALDKYETTDNTVSFTLENNQLTLSHYGKPFNKKDVDSICDACRSTKTEDENKIGKYGIGFKLVGAFTTSPQIFSGDKSFEIKDLYDYSPIAPLTDLAEGETRIILPFENPNDAFSIIEKRLIGIHGRDILFLRHIKALNWQIEGDIKGNTYITKKEKKLDSFARRVTITSTNPQHEEETWIIFSKGKGKKRVEIAFLQQSGTTPDDWKLTKYGEHKTLYCYLPLSSQNTGLKFLVQGAFKTIPSRSALVEDDEYNNALIERASELLIEILFWLKEQNKLDWDVFDCLPIGAEFFNSKLLFSPMAKKIREALKIEKLLPTEGGGFVTAEHAKLPSQNKKLMKIFDDKKISALFSDKSLCWLKAISSEEFKEVRDFLRDELDIKPLNLSSIMRKEHITKEFMEDQDDKWIEGLYTFLFEERFYPKPQKYKNNPEFYFYDRSKFYSETPKTLPLIRLKDNRHTYSHKNDEPHVYLPSPRKHPKTIKATTIEAKEAEAFIKSLGIGIYDDTEDLIKRLEQAHTLDLSQPEQRKQYEDDIERIVTIQKDKKPDKERFIERLKSINFVNARNMKTGKMTWKNPDNVYLATDNFKALFGGVEAYLVDDALMAKDGVSEMLVQCGVKNCLQYIETMCHLSRAQQEEKLKEKDEDASDIMPARNKTQKNHGIEHLKTILEETPEKEWQNKAKILWDELGKMRPIDPDNAEYAKARHYYTNNRHISYEAEFVYILNKYKKWIPASDGTIKKPQLVFFRELDWEPPKGIQSEIHFKKSIMKKLQESAGLGDRIYEIAMDMQDIEIAMDNGTATPEQEARYKKFQSLNPTENEMPEPKDVTPEIASSGAIGGRSRQRGIDALAKWHSQNKGSTSETAGGYSSSSSPGTSNGRGGGGGTANPEVAERAIEAVIEAAMKEGKKLIDANEEIPNNPGFDLYEVDKKGKPIKWVEVKGKAEAHNEDDVPVMTPTQRGFALGLHALGEGHRYVHITVSNALTDDRELHPVENPANKDHEIDKDSEE